MKTNFSYQFLHAGEDTYLREVIKMHGISKRALTAIKYSGGKLVVNGEEKTVRTIIRDGDQIEVIFPEEELSDGLIPVQKELTILYEDDHILIVNKPSGLPAIPSKDHPNDSLANRIAGYYKQQDYKTTVHMVTRLDKDTTGLVLIAKHRHAHHLLSEAMQRGAIQKRYRAVVEGIPIPLSGEITAKIGREDHSIIKRCISDDGKTARTSYDFIRTFRVETQDYTYLELYLWTGRTHQIRVHMAHIGCPLAGDDLYGGSQWLIPRHALHAYSLSFPHPITRTDFVIECPLPGDFTHILERGHVL